MTTTTDPLRAPGEAGDPDRLILRDELRAMAGDVSGETLRRWSRAGKLPPPDVLLSRRTQGWRLSTLRAAGLGFV